MACDDGAAAALPASQTPTSASVTMDDLYGLPEGTVLWKPDLAGWSLWIKEAGVWRCVDAYNRDMRGERWTPTAINVLSAGYVIHTPPAVGYYDAGRGRSASEENRG